MENNFKIIQKQFNDIDIKFQNKEKISNGVIENKINTLDKQLEENQNILIKLENNKKYTRKYISKNNNK